MNGPAWHHSRFKRLQISLIVAIAYPVLACLGRTLRWRVVGLEHFQRVVDSGTPPIMAFWHGRILPGSYYFRNRGIVVLTSQNFDGEWIARIIMRFGYGAVRGSSSRNASGALREMIRHVRAGRGVAFALDGPRGPLRQAKSGAVWLASATGSPIVPFHLEADRAWTTTSWDQGQIPKPFSTVTLAMAEPLFVPRGLDPDGIEQYRTELEARLANMRERAESLAKGGRA